MPDGQFGTVLNQIRRLLGRRECDSLTDGQLLQRFAAGRDETAFTDLVQRHGPMVLRLCRSILHNAADADDAFQASFLVLARKAGSIRKRDSVASWLYGVAYRIAVRARAAAARRRTQESHAPTRSAPTTDTEADMRDLEVLHEELERLPEKDRAPLVLCFLEGKTHQEAASELGWPRGSMAHRLATAQERLRLRLAGRGVALSLAAILAEAPASAALPTPLLATTVQAALAFTAGNTGVPLAAAAMAQGALNMLFWTKIKTAALVLTALVVLGSSASVVAYRLSAADQPGRTSPDNPETALKPTPPEAVASEPVVKDGLSLVIRPARPSFAMDEAPQMEVEIKNTTAKPLTINVPSIWIAGLRRFDIESVAGQNKWTSAIHIPGDPIITPRLLRAGETLKITAGLAPLFSNDMPGAQDQHLAVGRYRATVTLNLPGFGANKVDRPWHGPITSKPAEFEIGTANAKPSEPVTKDGLSISVRPARPVFAPDRPLLFVVIVRNQSDKALRLHDPIQYNWKFFCNTGQPGEDWSADLAVDLDRVNAPTIELQPRESVELPITLSSYYKYRWQGADVRPTPRDQLPPGKYAFRARIIFPRFQQPDEKNPAPFWIGDVTSKPAPFEISPPPAGGPDKK